MDFRRPVTDDDLQEELAVCDEALLEAYLDGRAVTDGRFVTGCGMGAATEFALALVNKLKGEDAAEKLRAAVLAK